MDVHQELYAALLEGSTLSSANVVVLVDLTCLWVAPFKAFLRIQQASTVPWFYIGFVESEDIAEWFTHEILELVSAMLLSKEFSFPGYVWKSPTPPTDFIGQPPARPCLTELVWVDNEDDDKLPSVKYRRMLLVLGHIMWNIEWTTRP